MDLKRIPALDGLRGVAILLVLWFHFRYYMGGEPIQYTLALLGEFGWIGVDLFFVISGFLITRILLESKKNDNYFGTFYSRRALRIFPLYFGALAILFLGPMSFLGDSLPTQHDRVLFWTYLANWGPLFEQIKPGSAAHFWSLSVEEQFYLVWPLLVWALTKKQLARLVVGMICSAPLIRTVMILCAWNPDWIYKNTFARMDTLAAGAGVALMLGCIEPVLIKRIGILSILIFVASFPRIVLPTSSGRPMQIYGLSAITLGCAAIIAAVVSGKFPLLVRAMDKKWLRAIGERSYGIYVFHMPIIEIAKHFFEPKMVRMTASGLGFLVILTMALVTGAIAFLSFHYFERPFLRLKSYFVAYPPLERVKY